MQEPIRAQHVDVQESGGWEREFEGLVALPEPEPFKYDIPNVFIGAIGVAAVVIGGLLAVLG